MRRIAIKFMVFLAAWACVLATPVYAQQGPDAGVPDARALMTQALAAYERGEYRVAGDLFVALFEQHRRCSILGNLAMARYREGGRDDEVLELIERARAGRNCEMRDGRASIVALTDDLLPRLRSRMANAATAAADAGTPRDASIIATSAVPTVDASVRVDAGFGPVPSDAGSVTSDASVAARDVPATSVDVLSNGQERRVSGTTIGLLAGAGASALVASLFWGWYIDAQSHLNDPSQGGSPARWQRASEISLGTGVSFTLLSTGLGIAGTVLYLLRPSQQARTLQVTPTVLRDGMGIAVGGRF